MKLKKLFDHQSKWTQGASARNKSGKGVSPFSRAAKQFCLLGAVNKCYPGTTHIWAEIANYVAHKYNIDPLAVIAWNDNPKRTFKEIQDVVNTLDI
jgi:hypothetical protein